MKENEIGAIVIDCAARVHQELGSGLLETVYETELAQRIGQRGLAVERQVSIPITFYGIKFEDGFHADLIVEHQVLLELKSVEEISKMNEKQVLTYLRLTGIKLGYLLNFGKRLMKDGVARIINEPLSSSQ